MKVAVVYNRESKKVINLFGTPNQEKIGLKTIKRIVDALKAGGHQATSFEGDKDLIDKLEEFMPQVVHGERPGMVFNVSYGIQGKARYTHVPSILEMVGIPYVGSNPLAHSLALDKVVSKMIFKQQGIPTADFAVLDSPESPVPDMEYPLIVKPKNEAVSFGIAVCQNEDELREAAAKIFEKYQQPVLVEQYIAGREVNVGILGNNPPETLPPAELRFGDGPQIYTYEDKTRRSGREIQLVCPAPIGEALTEQVKDVARKAFQALQCSDCCRVDMRIDDQGNVYVLEVNSLPSMGEHGSYVEGAAQAGLDFQGLVNKLVEVASARYFGTPVATTLSVDPADAPSRAFAFVTDRRDETERRLRGLVKVTSRTADRIGIREVATRLDKRFRDLGLKPVADLTVEPTAWAWQTSAKLEGGTLILANLDVPLGVDEPPTAFRRDPEWLHGEGIGSSRGPLAAVMGALRAVKRERLLSKLPLGVLVYADEGDACEHSAKLIRDAAAQAKRVLIVRPGTPDGKIVSSRRGQRVYRLKVEGKARRPGAPGTSPDVLRWTLAKLERLASLSSRKERLSVSAADLHSQGFPTLLPHRVRVRLVLTYGDIKVADATEEQMRILLGKDGPRWELHRVSDRPPYRKRKVNAPLVNRMKRIAEKWELPLDNDSSVTPSPAGLVPASVPVVCGLGPVARSLHTPQESVQRLSLLQRTILLAQLFIDLAQENKAAKP